MESSYSEWFETPKEFKARMHYRRQKEEMKQAKRKKEGTYNELVK